LIEISGEKGQLVGDHVLNRMYTIGPDGVVEQRLGPARHTVPEILRAVVQDIRSGRPPTISYTDGAAAIAAADACYRSVASGRPERVVMPQTGP
jgi:predicted dehydrogenase